MKTFGENVTYGEREHARARSHSSASDGPPSA